jgi:hypothetical protein
VLARPSWSARVYETPGGLRVLLTHELFDPTGADANDIFNGASARASPPNHGA